MRYSYLFILITQSGALWIIWSINALLGEDHEHRPPLPSLFRSMCAMSGSRGGPAVH